MTTVRELNANNIAVIITDDNQQGKITIKSINLHANTVATLYTFERDQDLDTIIDAMQEFRKLRSVSKQGPGERKIDLSP